MTIQAAVWKEWCEWVSWGGGITMRTVLSRPPATTVPIQAQRLGISAEDLPPTLYTIKMPLMLGNVGAIGTLPPPNQTRQQRRKGGT